MSTGCTQNIYDIMVNMADFIDLPQIEYNFPKQQLQLLIFQDENTIDIIDHKTSYANDFRFTPYLSKYLLENKINIRKISDMLRKIPTSKVSISESVINFTDFPSDDDIDRLFRKCMIYRRSKETVHIVYNKLLTAFIKNSNFKIIVAEKNDNKRYISVFTLKFINNMAKLDLDFLDFTMTDEVYDEIYKLYLNVKK